MLSDRNGDGMTGPMYYNRGHVTFKRNLWGKGLTVVAVIGMAFVISVIVGALFYNKPAQSVLQNVVGGVEHIRNTQ